MYSHDHQLRVRYGETDQMGFVYYGRYAEFFEIGRVETMRSLGFPYKRIEEEGVRLPVHELKVKYHKPARYDDLLTVRTMVIARPTVRIVFRYEVLNEAGLLLTEAETTLVFIDTVSGRPRTAPPGLVLALARYFN
jgi:acyl-CoA thioester hydrolase